jgi:hypothetical protein
MSNAKAKWRTKIAAMRCVVGNQHGGCQGRTELHHVAEGSGQRHDYSLVPLCEEHHRGATGLHGLGPKAFLRLYRPPGESEYGLLIWMLEQLARAA